MKIILKPKNKLTRIYIGDRKVASWQPAVKKAAAGPPYFEYVDNYAGTDGEEAYKIFFEDGSFVYLDGDEVVPTS